MRIKKKRITTYIRSILLYMIVKRRRWDGTRKIDWASLRRCDCLRWKIRMSWIEYKTNEAGRSEWKKNNDECNNERKRIGHLSRFNRFIATIMEDRIYGIRTRGRSRKCFFEEIFRLMKFTSYRPSEKTEHVTDVNGHNDNRPEPMMKNNKFFIAQSGLHD